MAAAIPLPDYDNYEFGFKETPAFISQLREKLKANPEQKSVGKDAFGHNYAIPSVSGHASEAAVNFLRNIKTKWLLELIEDQVLDVCNLSTEATVGRHSISITRVKNAVNQYIFHIKTETQTQIAEVQTSVSHDGLVSDKLETICQKRTELLFGPTGVHLRKCYIEAQEDGDYLVNTLSDDNGSVTSWFNVYQKEQLSGFLSECAHVLLSRLFACDETLPEGFSVLALDKQGCFQEVKYEAIKPKLLTFRPYRIDCFGFAREFPSANDRAKPLTEEYYVNRRLVYREEKNTGFVIRTKNIPNWKVTEFIPPTELQIPASVRMEDDWFMQTRNEALGIKKNANLEARYPQLTQPLKEMVHLVLTFRPDDVFEFVTQSFRHWRNMFNSKPKQENKQTTMLLSSEKGRAEQERTEVTELSGLPQLLRAYGI